mgnify:CR=1 FL=1
MHRYFLIPVISFFIIIVCFVIYLQFINDDWKFLVPKTTLPDTCNDEDDVKIIVHNDDKIKNRSFKDFKDTNLNKHQIHTVLLLPCERIDRKLDVNLKIQSSLLAINKWFNEKSLNQKLNFDTKPNNNLDITFIRVNKTMNWFMGDLNNQEGYNQNDVSNKIEKIIINNSEIFNNFNKKKFIVFFEGWEKRKYLNYDICGKSRFDGKVAIYYTYSPFKKYIGKDPNIRNRKQIFSCTKNDHLNEYNDNTFGNAEETILHEILHTLGAPAKCAKNIDPINPYHVSDSINDILYKISGNVYLDFNNDDYYNHNIVNCPDLKNSKYLKNN